MLDHTVRRLRYALGFSLQRLSIGVLPEGQTKVDLTAMMQTWQSDTRARIVLAEMVRQRNETFHLLADEMKHRHSNFSI
jgi:hypothetical protein